MSTPLDTSPEPTPSLPSWMSTFATFIALGSFYLTSQSPVLPIVGLLLLGTHVTTLRFDRPALTPWLFRLVLFASIAMFNRGRPSTGADWLFDGRTVSIIGQLIAAELLIQQWTRPATKPPHGIAVLLNCLIFMAACNTYEDRYVHAITPVFMLFIALSLRDIHRRGANSELRIAEPPRIFAVFSARHWAAMGLAIGLGASVHFGIFTSRDKLNMLGMQLLRNRAVPQAGGITQQPQLGDTFETQDSPARVLRLRNYTGSPHLRGTAFDTYGAGRWNPTVEQRSGKVVTPVELKGGARGTRAQVTRFIEGHGLLFAPLNAAGIAVTEDLEYDFERGGPLKGPELAPFDYEIITGNEEFHQGPLCLPLTSEQRERCLQLPQNLDERVRALAKKIGGNLPTPFERVKAVEAYLMANHKYSRSTRHRVGDPVTAFLMEKRSAHCEYFASAATILLRCLDVPTRYTTGFFAHEEGGPNITIVRQRDAHAWAESYIEGVGWVTVEATPADGQPDSLSKGVPAWMKIWEWIQDRFAALREQDLSKTMPFALGGLLLFGLAIRVWLMRRRRVGAPGGFRYTSPDAELRAITTRFEQLMERNQVACPEQLTWQEHTTALARENGAEPGPIDMAKATVFLQEYNSVRFGRPDDRVAIAHLSTTLQQLEADTRACASSTRRTKEHR